MARKLAANVYVGETLYRKGTSPEKDIADQITNPAAWGESEPDSPAPADPGDPGDSAPADAAPAEKKAPAKKAAAKKTAKK